MESFGDDLLSLILRQVSCGRDRKSCSKVCLRWRLFERLTRSCLHIFEPSPLHFLGRCRRLNLSIAPLVSRFPNLTTITCGQEMSNSDLFCVAEFCPKLQSLLLEFCHGADDELDDGLCRLARRCRMLREVSFCLVGNEGVTGLVLFAENLSVLDLAGCTRVSDEGVLAISAMCGSLTSLCLMNCHLVTDSGLSDLAAGRPAGTLKKLDLKGCNITDDGASSLGYFSCLEDLELGDPEFSLVTNEGGFAISQITSLRRLILTGLDLLTDESFIAVAWNCKSLVEIGMLNSRITYIGLRALAKNCRMLERLTVSLRKNLSIEDILEAALLRPSLKFVRFGSKKYVNESSDAYRELNALCLISYK